MNFKNLFLSNSGRIGRQSFWIGIIIIWIVSMVAQLFFYQTGIISISSEGIPSSGFGAVNIAMFLIFIWPSICIGAKRCHDRNKSAWWMLLLFIPIIGFFWYLIECGCLKGTDGNNHFGPDPLAK